MKKMIAATLFALTLCGLTNVAVAQVSADSINSLDVRGLSPEQKAQLMAQAVELKKQTDTAGSTSELVRKEAEQWINLGGNMGRATGAAAKELGVAANDFIETPLGKVTMAVVIYKVIGSEMIHILFGSLIFTTTIILSIYLFRKKTYSRVTYDTRPVLWGLYTKRVISSYEINHSSSKFHTIVAFWTLAVGTAINTIVVLTV